MNKAEIEDILGGCRSCRSCEVVSTKVIYESDRELRAQLPSDQDSKPVWLCSSRPSPKRPLDTKNEQHAAPHNINKHTPTHLNKPIQVKNQAQWSCRESNPGPTAFPQGFSVRSSLCLCLDLLVTRTSQDGDPSRCKCPDEPRDRTHRWIPLADARIRGEGVPGLTD